MINALKNGAFCLNKEVCGWDSVDSAVNIYFYGSTEKAITGIVNGELYATYEATVVSESTRVFKEFNDELKTRIKENSGS